MPFDPLTPSPAPALSSADLLALFVGTPPGGNPPADDEGPGKSGAKLVPPARSRGVRLHRIVIVGGGAGGLELAARLGDDLGRRGKAEIALVDEALTHLWKPLLHEVAVGTLSPRDSGLDFLQQARRHHFRFHLGRLDGLVRDRRQIWLAPLIDEEGTEIAPRRPLGYDTLVIAIGATDHDFGTPGARRHALSLNTPADAERFHRRLLSLCARAELSTARPVRVAIVGGGATGVELAAELAGAAAEISSYGTRLRRLEHPVEVHVVEAGVRLLAGLPDELVRRVEEELRARGVEVRLGRHVVEVREGGLGLHGGGFLSTDLVVWAAGVRGPEVLATLDGLDTNERRQLLVRPTLQTFRDDDIFAIGDCASCLDENGRPTTPPKAQAAQQEARLLARSLRLRLAGRPLPAFRYRERGALIPLGEDAAAGVLGAIAGGQRLRVGGTLARLSYWILYRRHLAVLLGGMRTLLVTLGQWLYGRAQPRVKLH